MSGRLALILVTALEVEVALVLKSHGDTVLRGVLFFLALVASLATLLATATAALAQTDVPDAPTAVAVYSIESQKLEVRWSTSDAASTTSFKIQWKSGKRGVRLIPAAHQRSGNEHRERPVDLRR